MATVFSSSSAASASPATATSVRFVDLCGVALSALCAVHCAVTPVLVTVLPAVAGEGTEIGLRRVLLSLGLVGVGLGTALHRDRRALVPLAGALMLALLLEVGAVVPVWEVFVSLAVSALLIAAHALNTRACNTHCASCAPARFWTAQVESLGASGMGRAILTGAAALLVHATILAIALRVEASPADGAALEAPMHAQIEVDLEAGTAGVVVPGAAIAPAGSPSNPEAAERTAPSTAHEELTTLRPTVPAPEAAPSNERAPRESPAVSEAPADEAPVAFQNVLSAEPRPARFDGVLGARPRSAVSGGSGHAGAPQPGSASGQGGRAVAGSAVSGSAVGGSTGAGAGGAVDGSELSRKPSQPAGLAARIEAHFPSAARLQLLGGTGRARLLVSPQGVVVRAEPVGEAPAGSGFGDACARALSGSGGWGAPLDASGRPVSTWIHFSCEFAIRH